MIILALIVFIINSNSPYFDTVSLSVAMASNAMVCHTNIRATAIARELISHIIVRHVSLCERPRSHLAALRGCEECDW